MFFVALATDFDGTLANHSHVEPSTIAALEQLRASGRKLIMVTGRDVPDLKRVFDRWDLFDIIIADNGGMLLVPETKEEVALTEPPSGALVARLRDRGVTPLSIGHTIVATWEPNEKIVLEAIRDLGLDHQITFNKGAVMVLPSGVNKASGLLHALARLKLSRHNVVGIGDAENDHSFLAACGCSVAVANALPSMKAKADLIVADHGAGVEELVRRLIEDDLADHTHIPRPEIGKLPDATEARVSPFETVLVTGSSGGGKSTIVTALLEQIRDQGYQFCVVDPEGDYGAVRDAIIIGDAKHEPKFSDIAARLAKPDTSIVVNLLAIEPAERPPFLARLLPELIKLRAATGRPHWIILDEVHHCLPAAWDPAPLTLPQRLAGVIAVTVHPEAVVTEFLEMVDVVIGVGEGGPEAIEKFRKATKATPIGACKPPAKGEVLVLRRGETTPSVVVAHRPKEKQQRHIRKYAEGQLGEDRSFYFRGPDKALNLRAQNLTTFVQLLSGVDDATWLHHLRAGEYSQWFRDNIKDSALADEAAEIEAAEALSAKDSRAAIKAMVERLYTAAAKAD